MVVDTKKENLNINLDFSKMLDAPNCKQGMILTTDLKIKDINCTVINGRKINVKVTIEIKFKIYSNEETQIVNSISDNEDIQVLQDNINVNSLVGFGTTKAYVKDTVMLDNTDNLAEILKINITMVDKDVKTSYNKVLAKAELNTKILYLTEENTIASITAKIPIVGFIDIPNVSEENICDTNFEIKNMVIKPNNTEEHSIHVEFEIEITCMAYEEKELNLVQDLYSPVEELKCNQKEITTMSNKHQRQEICHIKEDINVPGLEEGNLIDVDCMPNVIKSNKLNSKIMYEGELELKLVWGSIATDVNISVVTIPFEFTIDNVENDEILNITTELEMGAEDFIIKSGGNITVDVDIIFSINMCKDVSLNIIDDIEVVENRDIEDYSLIIYLVKSGDTLWNIAKNLGSTVEDIIRANGLEDQNSIKAGDKLYIPKYIKKGVRNQAEEPAMMNYA